MILMITGVVKSFQSSFNVTLHKKKEGVLIYLF